MEHNNKLSVPEDDEDLESLRLMALQSLKKKTQTNEPTDNYYAPRGLSKRATNKFVRLKNGQFNGWGRNSNLIAVPMVQEAPADPPQNKTSDPPRLVLPQDRYCNNSKTTRSDAPSKFDRYNNSDESESETEDDTDKSDGEPSEIKDTDSLEAIMADLENEINPKIKEEKAKKTKKRKLSLCESPAKTSDTNDDIKENVVKEAGAKPPFEGRKFRGRRHGAKWHPKQQNQRAVFFQPPPMFVQPNFAPVFNGGGFMSPPPPLVPTGYGAPPPGVVALPPVFERPLSPLVLNSEFCGGNAMGPLSPRSAAFVMQNRAIIEKRKRRSYSRSPSPARFRRSKSPTKRLSLSPKRSCRNTPKNRSLSPSPIRKVSSPPKKSSSVHDRLGTKSVTAKSPPEPSPLEEDTKKVNLKIKQQKETPTPIERIDPVLEARRKKFERTEAIAIKEGVIRLKTKEDEDIAEAAPPIDDLDDDSILLNADEILLDDKIDGLFSDDEESDRDDDGRFKTTQPERIVPIHKASKSGRSRDDRRRGGNNRRVKRYRSRSPRRARSVPKKNDGLISGERKVEVKSRKAEKSVAVENTLRNKIEKKFEVKEDLKSETVVVDSKSEAAGSNPSDGDLRAQLSRKRAERQKVSLPEVVPSRLLKNALQGVCFRKEKSVKKRDKDETAADRRLPIYLRLGDAKSSEQLGKKSRKHKNKGSLEQV